MTKTNAIQASAKGERVFVKTHLLKDGVAIDVIDRGCGIAQENHERVFEAFFSTKNDGTGLGLGNVKKIVQAHGGEVTFRANTEKGITFTVRFPRKGISRKTSCMLTSANMTGKTCTN